MHRQWTDTYATRVQQEANLYANTCESMQDALAKLCGKCEFLERAYAQLIALKVNAKAGKAIKNVKTTAQAIVQNVIQVTQHLDKTVRVRTELRQMCSTSMQQVPGMVCHIQVVLLWLEPTE